MNIYHTYDEWKLIGRQVRRGEISHKRNTEAIAMFELSQTISQEEIEEERSYLEGFRCEIY